MPATGRGRLRGRADALRSRGRALAAALACGALVAAAAPALALAALPAVSVDVVSAPLANVGQHRGVTVTAGCPAGARLTGGGSYLRNASDPLTIPTNGLVLGGTTLSQGAAPVDLAAGDGAVDPASWMTIANYTGQSEAGNQASSFALCATDGGAAPAPSPAHTVVVGASRTGTVAQQQLDPPNVATATCPDGSRLIGGGAATSTPDQVNDGVTPGNNGNLKPLGSYPSSASGAPAADGARDATSWSAFGSAGMTSATDTVTAYALCSSDPATPAVQVARTDVDGPPTQPSTTALVATARCPDGTRLLGGGYRIDETVPGVGAVLQPQQGYHMRGSYPSAPPETLPPATEPVAPVADGAADPGAWTALVQAGGQTLPTGDVMTNHTFALCATPPPEPDSADLALTLRADPHPEAVVGATLTYTLEVANGGPGAASGTVLEQTLPAGVSFTSVTATSGSCDRVALAVTCALGDLPAGAGATVTVQVVVEAAEPLASSATLGAATADPNAADNAAAVTTAGRLPVLAEPSLTARAVPATAVLGAAIGAEATLGGGDAPGGAIAFALYGPGDETCAIPLTTSTDPLAEGGAARAAPYVTSAPGTYRWVASYAGDGANAAVATSCGDPSLAVTVKAAPTLSVAASPSVVAGGSISASATIGAGTILTGTLAFDLYGPGDDGCATPIASFTAALSGNGIYAAPRVAAAAPGTYRWVARYGGDASNFAAGPTACGDPAGAVVVLPDERLPLQRPLARPAPSNAFALGSVRPAVARGRIAVRLRSPGRGVFRATATVLRGRTTYRFGTRTVSVRGRGATAFTISPGPRARRDLRRRGLRVRVAVRFVPAGGTARTRTSYVTLARAGGPA